MQSPAIPVPSPVRRIPMRVHGENLLMSRSAWLGLADELAPDSELLARLRDRLVTDYAEQIRETTCIDWDRCCHMAEVARDERPGLFAASRAHPQAERVIREFSR